jgi:hypothetical protein
MQEGKTIEVNILSYTYLGQRVIGVEKSSCAGWDLHLCSQSSQRPNPLVEILFLQVLVRHSRRIGRTRVRPQLSSSSLKGLDASLKEERHKLRPYQSAPRCALESLNMSQKRHDDFNFGFRRRSIPPRQLGQILVGIKRRKTILIRGSGFLVLDIEPFFPLALHRINHVELQVM